MRERLKSAIRFAFWTAICILLGILTDWTPLLESISPFREMNVFSTAAMFGTLGILYSTSRHFERKGKTKGKLNGSNGGLKKQIIPARIPLTPNMNVSLSPVASSNAAINHWVLTPKTDQFPCEVKKINHKQQNTRWPDLRKRPVLTPSPRIDPKGKVKKPEKDSAVPTAPAGDNAVPSTSRTPLNHAKYLRGSQINWEKRSRASPMIFAPGTVRRQRADEVYRRLCKHLAEFVPNPRATDLRREAVHRHEPEVDWESYLSQLDQEMDTAHLSNSHPSSSSTGNERLTRLQASTLARHVEDKSFLKASVEDIYNAIASITARERPSASFLRNISKEFGIRQDIDWDSYLENYVHPKNGQTPSSKTSSTASYNVSDRPFRRNDTARAVDDLGNEIKIHTVIVHGLTKEIPLVMSGALGRNDPKPLRVPDIDTLSSREGKRVVADAGDQMNGWVQPLRLINGSKLPRLLWVRSDANVYDKLAILKDALAEVKGPNGRPITLQEYRIPKWGVIEILNERNRYMQAPRYKVLAENPNKNDAEKAQMEEWNIELDRITANYLVRRGGRFPDENEVQELESKGVFNARGRGDVKYAEDLLSVCFYDLARLEENDRMYWDSLYSLGREYWASVDSLINAARIGS